MKTIGVFFGSRSPEHDVSIITGQLIIQELKKMGYRVVPVYITRTGTWLTDDRLGDLKTFTDPSKEYILHEIKLSSLDLKGSGQSITITQKGLFGKAQHIDIAFPAFHGQNGEDGTFQGICELLDIPYVGCDVPSSALAMDKILTKMIYKANSIPTTSFIQIDKNIFETNKNQLFAQVTKQIGLPVIIKPSRLGSSIGISRANNVQELEFGIEVALHYDYKVIVEQCITNLIDVTCCVIGNEDPKASLLQESAFDKDFFSYEDKYIKEGGAQTGKAVQNIIIPARLDKITTEQIQKTAIQVYKLIGCSGIARVDFLYDKDTKKYYANEINTLPGTLYHHLWKDSGLEFESLLQKLIDFSLDRYEKKHQLTYTFESSILQKTGSTKLQLMNK